MNNRDLQDQRPFPFLQASEFDPTHVDASRNIPKALLDGCGGRVGTALQYFEATRNPNDPAGQFIDAGHEPYLAGREAYSMGTWPWLEVEDIGSKLGDDGFVTLYVGAGALHVPPDTLLFWR